MENTGTINTVLSIKDLKHYKHKIHQHLKKKSLRKPTVTLQLYEEGAK